MAVKLSELRVTSTFDASKYKAGMDQKVAADAAGTASSQALATTTTQTYQKISQSGNVLDKLSKQYINGYAATARFETAIRSLGRGVETGNVSLEQAGVIIDGIYKKFGLAADAASVEAAGFTKLSAAIAEHNAVAKVGSDALVVLGSGAAKTASSVELSSTQWQELGHVARNTFVILASGGGVFQALTLESARLATFFGSGNGGVGGTLKALGGVLSGLLSPARLATLALGALAAVGTTIGVSWADAQEKIGLALTGIGSAAGVTASDINSIAQSVARAGDLSVSEARDIATALASTGKVSTDIVSQVTALGHQVELVFGTDAKGAADLLAQALADPAKGVDDLNKRLAVFDAATVDQIKNLSAENHLFEAQTLLTKGLQKSIGDAAAQTTSWEKAWLTLKTAASSAIESVGQATNNLSGNGTPEDQLRYVQAQLQFAKTNRDALQQGLASSNPEGLAYLPDLTELEAKEKALQDLIAKNKQNAANAAAITESINFQDLVRGIDPTFSKLTELDTTLKRLKDDFSNPKQISLMTPESLLEGQHAIEIYQNLISLKNEYLNLSTQEYGIASATLGQAIRQAQIDQQSINARSPSQKADVAYQQALNESREQGVSFVEALHRAEIARSTSLLQSQHDLSEAARDRMYQNQQDLDQGQIQNDVIGRSVDVSTKLTAQFQLLAAAKEEAFKNGTTVSMQEQLQALIDADEKARQALVGAQKTVATNTSFSNDQLGRTATEQTVYSTMQSAGLLDNGQIVGAANLALAAQVRLNTEMSKSKDIWQGFGSDLVHDLMQGKSALDSLSDALQNFLGKLIDNQLDVLFANLQKLGALPNLFNNLSLGGGSASGNWITSVIPSAKGNVFSQGRLTPFANGGIVNGPTLFPMATGAGLMGEAGPEAVVPLKRGPDGKLGVAGGGSNVEINVINNSGAPVSTQKRQSGDKQIVDLVIGTMNNAISSGKTDRAMATRFGARPLTKQR